MFSKANNRLVCATITLIRRRDKLREMIQNALEELEEKGRTCDLVSCICGGDNPTCVYRADQDDLEMESDSDEGFHD